MVVTTTVRSEVFICRRDWSQVPAEIVFAPRDFRCEPGCVRPCPMLADQTAEVVQVTREVAHGLRDVGAGGDIEFEVGPQRRAEEPHTLQDHLVTVEQMNVGPGCGCAKLCELAGSLAYVKLVVARHEQHRFADET